jgi:hypothetical protein
MDQLKSISVGKYWDMLLNVRSTMVIMGTPGLCKTTLPGQVAEFVGGRSYVIPVAQYSETGDVSGMPDVIEMKNPDGTPMLREDGTRVRKTVFAPPESLPTEGKGFLVIDDFNRANTLILQSLLHLAQYRAFGDYQIPPLVHDDKGNWVSGYKLIFTGNQDEGDISYIVNEVDDAFWSRTLSWKLSFDKLSWGKWARREGIEEKFISFILKNSSEAIDPKNNPRAWSNGFMELRGNSENLDYVSDIMSGCVTAHDRLTTWLRKEWTTLNFDSNDVFDDSRHKALMDIFRDKATGYDGQMLFVERLATLDIKEIDDKQVDSLCKFLHLLLKEDKEKFMVAFVPLNSDCSRLADDELFEMLIPSHFS